MSPVAHAQRSSDLHSVPTARDRLSPSQPARRSGMASATADPFLEVNEGPRAGERSLGSVGRRYPTSRFELTAIFPTGMQNGRARSDTVTPSRSHDKAQLIRLSKGHDTVQRPAFRATQLQFASWQRPRVHPCSACTAFRARSTCSASSPRRSQSWGSRRRRPRRRCAAR